MFFRLRLREVVKPYYGSGSSSLTDICRIYVHPKIFVFTFKQVQKNENENNSYFANLSNHDFQLI
jgi:hypothetical protein